MTSQVPSRARRLIKPILTVCAGVVTMLAFSGCFDFLLVIFQRLGVNDVQLSSPLTVTLSRDAGVRGRGPISCTIAYSPSLPPYTSVVGLTHGVPRLILSILDEEGQAPPGISVSPSSFVSPGDPPGIEPGTPFTSPLTVELTISGDAPARPFRIVLNATGYDVKDVGLHGQAAINTYYNGEALFFVSSSDAVPAPRLTSVATISPAERGTTIQVEFAGQNFDQGAAFSAEYGVLVQSPQDSGPGKVRATLELPRDMPTGSLRFHVETPSGRSNRASITVLQGRPDPELAGFFPNYGPIGRTTTVNAAGTGFNTGAMVLPEDGSDLPLSGAPVVLSPNVLRQDFRPTGATGQEFGLVTSLGRLSNLREFNVEAANYRGPRIVRVNPDAVYAGAPNQVEITWENYTNESEPELIALPNEQFSAPLTSARALKAQERPPSNRSVAILDVPPATADGYFHLAARTADGRNTNLEEMRIFSATRGEPLVQRTQTGRVGRGAEVLETLFGERLQDVSEVRFSSPKITGELIRTANTATSVQLRIHAEEDAPLTGDERTTFYLETSAGRRSNPVSYIVEPGGGSGSAPLIDLLLPNWVAEGGGSRLWINGANFAANSTVAFFPAESVDPYEEELEILDAHNLLQPYLFPRSTGRLAVSVVTPGAGPSARADLVVIDRDLRQGPESSFTGNRTIISGARSQITVFGDHLVEGGATTVIGLRTEAFGNLIAVGTFYPNLNSGSGHAGVVELQPAELAAPVPIGGAIALFSLKRGDGLTTYPYDISIYPLPDTGPVVTSVFPSAAGELRRGTTRTMRIFGRRLTGVNGISFTQTGVSIPATAEPIHVIDDNEINVSFIAETDAVITGDETTTFFVTNGTETSNEASFIVLP